MPWVEFTELFRWSPPPRNGQVTIHFKPGVRLVTTACAKAAIAAGKARPAERSTDRGEPDIR